MEYIRDVKEIMNPKWRDVQRRNIKLVVWTDSKGKPYLSTQRDMYSDSLFSIFSVSPTLPITIPISSHNIMLDSVVQPKSLPSFFPFFSCLSLSTLHAHPSPM